MNPTLQGYSACVIEAADPAVLEATAADLGAIERLVLSNGPLRSALSDTAVPGTARRNVLLGLLEGRVNAEARRLAAFAAMVVAAPEVTPALGWLANRVRHVVEGQPLDELPLSLLQARRRVAGYATALHEDMTNQELESLEDDLFRFARIVSATPALRGALTDRDLVPPARRGLVAQLLEGKVPPTSVALAGYVVTGGRARDFVGTLDYLVEQTALARGWRIARVQAAAPIGDEQRLRLEDSLRSLVGAPVELQVEIDEALLSGARIRIGDLQVDATARGRIDALREHLNSAGWEPSEVGPSGRTQTSTHTEGAQ